MAQCSTIFPSANLQMCTVSTDVFAPWGVVMPLKDSAAQGALPNGSDDHVLVVGNHDSISPSLIRHRCARETNDALNSVDPIPSRRRRRMVDEAGVAKFVKPHSADPLRPLL